MDQFLEELVAFNKKLFLQVGAMVARQKKREEIPFIPRLRSIVGRVRHTLSGKADIKPSAIQDPYIGGSPITDPKMFVGGKDLSQRVEQEPGQSGTKNIVFHGAGRMGEISLYSQIVRWPLCERFVPAHLGMQEVVGSFRAQVPTCLPLRLFVRLRFLCLSPWKTKLCRISWTRYGREPNGRCLCKPRN